MSIGNPGVANGVNVKELTQKLTGDFDIQINLNLITFPATDSSFALFYAYIDNHDYFYAYRYRGAAVNRIVCGVRISDIQTQDVFDTADTSVSFRIVRSNGTVTLYYDLDQSDNWTQLYTKDGCSTSDIRPVLRFNNTTNFLGECSWTRFKVNGGTFDANGTMTTGNRLFTTDDDNATLQPGTGKCLSGCFLYCSNMSETEKIKLEFLIGDTQKAITDWITTNPDTYHHITDSDLTSGNFGSICEAYKVRVYMEGDGSTSPVMTQITINEKMISGRPHADNCLNHINNDLVKMNQITHMGGIVLGR